MIFKIYIFKTLQFSKNFSKIITNHTNVKIPGSFLLYNVARI